MRKIWGERDARACVKAAKTAGLGLGAWARAHGVDGRSLHAWAVNLGLVTRPAVKPKMIELVPMPSPPMIGAFDEEDDAVLATLRFELARTKL